MLSSTVVLGLFFVLFMDAIARPSRGNSVIPYAEHLQAIDFSDVQLESPRSRHATSGSSSPVSRPIDNARRALSGGGMSNDSSLDALGLVLVDNSSNPVEAIKSTPVINDTETPTCYASREAAPISTPANCHVAINEMMGRRDPHDIKFWRRSKTWSYYTCKVQLVPRNDHGDCMTRQILSQAASLIQSHCITAEHGYRGGYAAVGIRMIFDLKIWASTSAGIVNETVPEISNLSDLPDLSGQEQIQR